MADFASWIVDVPRATDDTLRDFLASRGRKGSGERSRFIEEAVLAHILDLTAAEAKQKNAGLSAEEIDGIVDEAVEWARHG